ISRRQTERQQHRQLSTASRARPRVVEQVAPEPGHQRSSFRRYSDDAPVRSVSQTAHAGEKIRKRLSWDRCLDSADLLRYCLRFPHLVCRRRADLNESRASKSGAVRATRGYWRVPTTAVLVAGGPDSATSLRRPPCI